MADSEPSPGSDDADATGGLSSLLNTTPRVIGSVTALIGAVTGLLIALNRAGVIGSGSGDGGTHSTSTDDGSPLFGPKTQGGGEGTVRLEDGTLYVTALEPGHGVRVLADQESPLRDVSLSAHVEWVSGADDWSFSLLCRFQDRLNYYLLGVIPSTHRYNIARYRDGKLRSLTGLRKSDTIRDDDNDVQVRCVGGPDTTLTLVVNGEMLARYTDRAGIDSGNVGIRAGSATGTVTTSFGGLVLRSL